MTDSGEHSTLLVNLAAEGIADLVSGCAQFMSSLKDSSRITLPDAVPQTALTYFGTKIAERWLAGLAAIDQNEQLDLLGQLASLPLAISRRQAAEYIDRLAGAASTEDKGIAVEYLSAIPLAVRRGMVQDPETGRMSLPSAETTLDAPVLVRLLPTDVPPFPIGSELPGTTYQLEELLGIGGFGAVYRAKNRCEQHQPARAIKFCLDATMVATLHRERTILDRLMSVDTSKWSTRIVRLYGYALDVQPPFLVYEYVSGGDLTSHLQTNRQKTGRGFKPDLTLELIRQVAEALAFAHSQGLVHRDLKPSNVLMSGNKIKLTDFGIGGVMATSSTRGTMLGASMVSQMSAADQSRLFRGSGTPLYMSPEQRRGEQPDPRHDLYSLGVMWYQLLVGDVTRELHPGWPDELIEEYQVPKEHTEVIQRCVGYFKKRPVDGSELLRLLLGPPRKEAAQTVTTGSRVSRPVSPTLIVANPLADQRQLEAKFEKLKLLLADQIERDSLAEARETITTLLRMKPNDAEVLEVRDFINERLTVPMNELHVFPDHKGWVRGVAFAPDGQRALSASDDQTVILWDMEARRPLRYLMGHTAAVMSVAFSPDGLRALSGSWDGTARLWDVNTGREIRRFEGNWKAIKCATFSPDGTRLLISSDDNRIHLYDAASIRKIGCLEGHTDSIQSVAFAPDSQRAVSGGDDNIVRVWDLETGRELRAISGHADSITSVAFAPNGRWVLSGSSDCTTRLWDAQTGKELRCFQGHKNWVNFVAFAPNALRLLTASGGEIVNGKFSDGEDKTVRIWDLQTERELFRFDRHQASVTCAAFAPNGRAILSGSLDKTVRLFEVPG